MVSLLPHLLTDLRILLDLNIYENNIYLKCYIPILKMLIFANFFSSFCLQLYFFQLK